MKSCVGESVSVQAEEIFLKCGARRGDWGAGGEEINVMQHVKDNWSGGGRNEVTITRFLLICFMA